MTMTANGLAKLIEECGELTQIAGKKLAMMNSDEHWDGAGSMKVRMEDEIADVVAACAFVINTFALDEDRIQQRISDKLFRFNTWHQEKE